MNYSFAPTIHAYPFPPSSLNRQSPRPCRRVAVTSDEKKRREEEGDREAVFGYGSGFSRMRDGDRAKTVALLLYRI